MVFQRVMSQRWAGKKKVETYGGAQADCDSTNANKDRRLNHGENGTEDSSKKGTAR